jgi:Icc-related predicted phosphoesterase
MLFVSDVHNASGPLRRLVELGEEVVILGDMVNLTDYRNGDGAVAEVLGIDFAVKSAVARASGDYATMRGLWRDVVGERVDEVRRAIRDALERQYHEVAASLEGGRGLVIHGNVDRPSLLKAVLPAGFRYLHGEVVERQGLRIGFVGGGVRTPLEAEGEIDDDEMERLLDGLGRVDVLCTHVPPALTPLRSDVVTGREERASAPVLEFLLRHRPRLHLFGDVHQAQATTWRVGKTRCVNVGYFRATGRYLRLDGAGVQRGRVG